MVFDSLFMFLKKGIRMFIKRLMLSLVLTCFAQAAFAAEFTLTSTDVAEGEKLAQDYVYKGFGCEGGNVSPALSWSNAPAGTKSYAITVYDPDAPTGSGWWHWNVVNIPASVTSLAKGAVVPESATELRNDYGEIGFGGACPPAGEVHRYHITIHALGTETLALPENASNALAGFMINANALAMDTITAVYMR
jgi:Raf kinase inhibitor-like YbhB/YbcL family protein